MSGWAGGDLTLSSRYTSSARVVCLRPIEDGLLRSILDHVLVSLWLFLLGVTDATISSFRGTLSGKGSHDEVARRIALNGQCWQEKSEIAFEMSEVGIALLTST